MIYKSHLSVVTFVGTLLTSAFSFEDSHGWQESARFCRERAMTLQRNGFQICQKYAFLDGGVFRGATNFRKDACLEDFGWVSFTNERNGTVVSAGFSGTNLSILSSIRTSGEKRVSSWYFSKGHMWHASDEVSNICFGVRFYLNGGVRETAACVDTGKGTHRTAYGRHRTHGKHWGVLGPGGSAFSVNGRDKRVPPVSYPH